MNDSASLEFYKLAEALKQKLATNKLASWKPYPKQKDFMQCVSPIKVMFGGNQCLAGDQIVYDPITGISRRIDEIDCDFHIESWDGQKRIIAKASAPYKKAEEDIYLVKFSNGSSIRCGAGHQLISSYGWSEIRDISNGLRESSVTHFRSTLGNDLLARVLDEARSIQIAVSSQFYYQTYSHSDDEQPLNQVTSDRDVLTSQDDVLGHRLPDVRRESVPSGDLGCKQEHTHLHQGPSRQTIPNGFHPAEVHEVESLFQTFCKPFLPKTDLRLISERFLQEALNQLPQGSLVLLRDLPSIALSSGVVSHRTESRILRNECQQHGVGHLAPPNIDPLSSRDPKSCGEVYLGQSDSALTRLNVALSASFLSSSISIEEISLDGKGEIWDFEVEATGNYFIGDILNHNTGKTTTICAEITYHLTGFYPDWWMGSRYNRPVDVWIAGETNIRVRDTLQEKLFGRPGQIGTGTIPKSYIEVDSIIRKPGIPYAIDIARIKHHTDGIEDGFDCETVNYPDIATETDFRILEAHRENGELHLTVLRKYASSCSEWDDGQYHEVTE